MWRWAADSQRHAVVALEAGRVCGFAMLKRDGEIGLLYVAPEARFRGASKAMLAELERCTAGWSLRRLSAFSSATARRFYLDRGFRAAGAPQKGFGLTQGYPMEKALGR